jgi:asparagine synthase (glutamine-hydrolysing)
MLIGRWCSIASFNSCVFLEATTKEDMSAIGGIFNFDGAPVNGDVLMALSQGLAHRGPDGGREVKSGSVGMVYRAFHTNRESRLESQPLVSSLGHLLCWDGRLDNREELIPILRDDLDGDHTDVAIVMTSYLKWGVDFPVRLVGDFALSLWDPKSRTLLLARDPVGVRLLYYHSNEHRIIWSTELESLLDLVQINLEINEEYIAEYIVHFPQPNQTPYKNIYGVLPAHTVIANNRTVQLRRFWGLNPGREIRYKTDTEYEEHFRHLFREAVRCRLRSDRPVWAELSGGLDSSTIVCMAGDIIKNGKAKAPYLETVSRVYDEASESDERKYIQPVEEKIGKRGVHLREDDYRILSPLAREYCRVIPNPVAVVAEYYKALSNAMHAKGALVLLSGEGGDLLLSSVKNPSPELTELLVRGRLVQLHRCLLVWSEASKRPYAQVLWRNAIRPALPDKLKLLPRNHFLVELSDFYCHEFANRMNFRGRLSDRDAFGFRYPIGRQQSKDYSYLVRFQSAGYLQGLIDLETAYPYTHRPLIEFMHAVPFDQRIRPWETRSIARRALRDLLPPEIANRKGKGSNAEAFLQALAREWQRLDELFTDARVCAYGYVNHKALKELLDLAKHGKDQKSILLISVIWVEYWLRALESRKAATPITLPATRSQSLVTAA